MVSINSAVSKGSITVTIQLALFQEDDIWIAYCPALDLSTYGEDEDDAHQAFLEAYNIFVSETNKKGTLERCLLNLGWHLQQKPKPVYNQPIFSLQENQKLLKKNPKIRNEKIVLPL